MFTAIYKTVQSALSSDSPTENNDESTDDSRSDSDIPSYPASQSSYDDSSEFEADVEVKNINGKVTKLLSGYGLINDDIYFSFDSVLTHFRPRVGDSINAIVYRDREKSGWRAKRVTVESKEWGLDGDDVPEDMIGIITKATKIETVINDVLQCSHDSIVQGYRPYSGDWIQACTYKDPETGTTVVKDVRPLRELKIYGTISHVYVGYGFIDGRTYFAFSACECGYVPHKGDRVVARCIESKQKRGNWRAIGVELKREKQLPRPEDIVIGPLQSMKADLMKDKCGVMITDKLDFGLLLTGKTKKINFWIRNVGIGLQALKNFNVCNLHSEITIDFPGISREDENRKEEDASSRSASLMILPGRALQGTITVKTQNLGKFRELVTFDFGSFQIGRHVYMEVQDEKMKLVGLQGDYSHRSGNSFQKYKDQYFYSHTGISVHGVRPTRTSNPNAPVKLKRHPVPDELVQCVLNKREVTFLIPELIQSLCIDNYFTRFSALLHLEEIQMEVDIRKYDLERESLRHRGEYLVLSVEGLAEGRPSVLVGDRIILTPIDAPPNTLNYEGYVHEVHGEEVLLKFHPTFHEEYVAEEYHITFTFSKTVLQRCHQAAYMAVNMGRRILFPTAKIIEVKPPQISITFPESQQLIKPTFKQPMIIPRVAAPARPRRGVVPNQGYLPRQAPSGDCQFIIPKIATSGRQRSSKRAGNKVVGEYFDKKLNARQKIAVFRILQGQTRPTPYILFGPPGTGKTVTVVESILQVHHHIRSSRVLACTPSNSAADLLTSRLVRSGRVKQNDLVRLNSFRRSEDNIEEDIKPYCTDGQMLEMVAHHRIIICTCSTAGSFFQLKLRPGHFTHVFVDEAGQAMEPECLIPVALATGDDSQLILAGDPMQLGPVMQSRQAIKLGLNQSLLERLMQRPVYRRDEKKFRDHGSYDPLLVTKLVDNYRSHECILHIPSNLFYHNELVVKADVEIRDKFKSWELLPNRENFPIIFHGIQGEELQEGNSPSWFNPAEAVQTLKYLQAILQQSDQKVAVTDCGIITPYRKQVEKIHVLLRSVDIDGVKVGSVEEFQGQEKPVIIISTVRSGEDYIGFDLRHKLGFLSNPKRFNVSVTRAQALLIVVGNPSVLAKDPKWLALLTYCARNNAYVGCELPDLDGQDEMELIRLERSFYDMPSDDEQEKEKENFSPKDEQANGERNFEVLQIKEDDQVTKDQGLSDLLRDLGILKRSEREDGVSGGTGIRSLNCSDVPQESEGTGIRLLNCSDVPQDSEETGIRSFNASIAAKENASGTNLMMENEQDTSGVVDVISCVRLDIASTKCEGTPLVEGLDNMTSVHFSDDGCKEHQNNLESVSSSCNSSHLLDIISNEQNVYKETGSLTSSNDPGCCQFDVCSKEFKDGRAAVAPTDQNNEYHSHLKVHEDNQKINSSIVTPDDKNTDKYSMKPECKRAVDSKRTTLESDSIVDGCGRNEKRDEVPMTAQANDNTSIIWSMNGNFDNIVSNLIDVHQNGANSHDESSDAEEPNQMKDLITFSDSDDSFVSKLVSGVISKQLVNLQEEFFGKKKLFQHNELVFVGRQCSTPSISCEIVEDTKNNSITDIDGSSVDPILNTSHPSKSSEIECYHSNEQTAFDVDVGIHTSDDDIGIDKHPSAVDVDGGKHPSTVYGDIGKLPSDVGDNDDGKHLPEVDKFPDVGDNDDAKHHPEVDKFPSAGDDDCENNRIVNGGCGQHPSVVGNDVGAKHLSTVSSDAGQHPSAVNVNAGIHLSDANDDGDGKHLSAFNDDAGNYPAVDDVSGKHPDVSGDEDIHPSDVNDNDCFDIAFLEVKTSGLSWFELTEHEDEFNLFTSTPLFPIQTEFPRKAPESMTSLCVSQGSTEGDDIKTIQFHQAECQLQSSKTKPNLKTTDASVDSAVLSGSDRANKYDSGSNYDSSLELSVSDIQNTDESCLQTTEQISEAIGSLHLSSESSHITYSSPGGNGSGRSTSKNHNTMSDPSSSTDSVNWSGCKLNSSPVGTGYLTSRSDTSQEMVDLVSDTKVSNIKDVGLKHTSNLFDLHLSRADVTHENAIPFVHNNTTQVKPCFDIDEYKGTNNVHCQQDRYLGTIEEESEESEGDLDDLPELECLITTTNYDPEVYHDVPKISNGVEIGSRALCMDTNNDGTHALWPSDEPPPLIELIETTEDGPPPLLEMGNL